MKLVCISDTHNKHAEIPVPKGDILVHAGDFTQGGTKRESLDFLKWFSAQPHRHKIFIAGNHEFFFEKAGKEEVQKLLPENVHYLKDSGVKINGVQFWGSPNTPGDGTWAFNKLSGSELLKHWEKIPETTDVLLTHTPAYKIKDLLGNGSHIGCASLLKTLQNRSISYHIFGHVHEAYGVTFVSGTKFINASCLDNRYRYLHEPVNLEITEVQN